MFKKKPFLRARLDGAHRKLASEQSVFPTRDRGPAAYFSRSFLRLAETLLISSASIPSFSAFIFFVVEIKFEKVSILGVLFFSFADNFWHTMVLISCLQLSLWIELRSILFF